MLARIDVGSAILLLNHRAESVSIASEMPRTEVS